MINPTIKPLLKKKKRILERCLSIPGLHGKVPRYSRILVKYYDLNKQLITHEALYLGSSLLYNTNVITLMEFISYENEKLVKIRL